MFRALIATLSLLAVTIGFASAESPINTVLAPQSMPYDPVLAKTIITAFHTCSTTQISQAIKSARSLKQAIPISASLRLIGMEHNVQPSSRLDSLSLTFDRSLDVAMPVLTLDGALPMSFEPVHQGVWFEYDEEAGLDATSTITCHRAF